MNQRHTRSAFVKLPILNSFVEIKISQTLIECVTSFHMSYLFTNIGQKNMFLVLSGFLKVIEKIIFKSKHFLQNLVSPVYLGKKGCNNSAFCILISMQRNG